MITPKVGSLPLQKTHLNHGEDVRSTVLIVFRSEEKIKRNQTGVHIETWLKLKRMTEGPVKTVFPNFS